MKIPFNKTRVIPTNELPGVICDPTLKFEFEAAPPFGTVQDINKWTAQEPLDESLGQRLAVSVIRAVIVPDGTRYPLETAEDWNDFTQQTSPAFVCNVLQGWAYRIAVERTLELGKLVAPSKA